jgi:SAM-dependent methyltransferase
MDLCGKKKMRSNEPQFWDERFRREGAIWGDAPSLTAGIASSLLAAKSRVLEIGFGYGRDLAFMLREGHRVSGIDLSSEARFKTEARLRRERLTANGLVTGRFEDNEFSDAAFDAVLSHRMAHLLLTDESVERFVASAKRVLRPRGILCLTVRCAEDLNPGEVRRVAGDVYDYTLRPGHRIRYWDEAGLRRVFGKSFSVLSLQHVTEIESSERPVPCHLTLMICRKAAAQASETLFRARTARFITARSRL